MILFSTTQPTTLTNPDAGAALLNEPAVPFMYIGVPAPTVTEALSLNHPSNKNPEVVPLVPKASPNRFFVHTSRVELEKAFPCISR